MTGTKMVIVWGGTGDEVAELYIDRRGFLAWRIFIEEIEEALCNVVEHLICNLGHPGPDCSFGYDYQPGPDGYLELAAGIVEDFVILGRPLYPCVMGISWCPYIPRSLNPPHAGCAAQTGGRGLEKRGGDE